MQSLHTGFDNLWAAANLISADGRLDAESFDKFKKLVVHSTRLLDHQIITVITLIEKAYIK